MEKLHDLPNVTHIQHRADKTVINQFQKIIWYFRLGKDLWRSLAQTPAPSRSNRISCSRLSACKFQIAPRTEMPLLLCVPVPVFDQPLNNSVAALALSLSPFLLFVLFKDSFHHTPLNSFGLLEAFFFYQQGCCPSSTALCHKISSTSCSRSWTYLRESVQQGFVCIFCSITIAVTCLLDICTVYIIHLILCKSN